MNYKFGLVIFVSVFMMSFGLPKNILKKVNATIESTFKVDSFMLEIVDIPSEVMTSLPSAFQKESLYKINTDNTLLAYAYIAKAPSKTDEFDYLVLFDKELIIKKTKVLIYREDYGGEIGSKRWLKQFIGKSQDDELKYRDNIAAISGATISVRSMTSAINTLLQSIKILQNKNII